MIICGRMQWDVPAAILNRQPGRENQGHKYHHDDANREQKLAMQILDVPEKANENPMHAWEARPCAMISLEKPLKSCKIQGN